MNAAGAATRSKILDVTLHHLLGGRGISLQEIAAAAGVTRQTVHFHFSSRAGLLVATARRVDARSRIAEQFAAALAAPTAGEALEATVRVWFDYVPRILPVARALQAAAVSDEAAAAAWWDRMDAFRLAIRPVIQRLQAEGELDTCWSVDDATDILWSVIHPLGWDSIVGHRGWSPERFTDRQVEVANRLLLHASTASSSEKSR